MNMRAALSYLVLIPVVPIVLALGLVATAVTTAIGLTHFAAFSVHALTALALAGTSRLLDGIASTVERCRIWVYKRLEKR